MSTMVVSAPSAVENGTASRVTEVRVMKALAVGSIVTENRAM